MQKNLHGVDGFDGVTLYIKTIGDKKILIATVTLVSFILSIVLALCLPKIYSSTVKILPPQQDQSLASMMMGQHIGVGVSLAGGLLGGATQADLYASILSSETIKDAIIDRFILMKVYDVKYRLDMYKKLDDLVIIKAGRKDGIISISVEDRNPKRAADIANAYVEELEKLNVSLYVNDANRNHVFYESRLVKARADLTKAEDALKSFQLRNKAFQVPQQVEATIGGIAQLKAQLVVQEIQLASLRRVMTDSSQEVKNTISVINDLRSQISRLENSNSTGALPSLGSVPALGQEYMRLMRELKVQESMVDLLTKQNELEKLTGSKNIFAIQIVQKGQVPDKKVRPKRALLVLGCTFVAFWSSVVFVLVRLYIAGMSEVRLMKWKEIGLAFSWYRAKN